MKHIAEIDPNFQLPETIPAGLQFYTPYDAPFRVFGVAPNARGVLCRLPEELLPACNEGVQRLAYHLAGACVRFSTDADQLAVLWELTETENMPHFAASGQSGLELFEETDSGTRHIKNLIPAMDQGHGCRREQSCWLPLPGGLRNYVLYLPLYNGLTRLLLGFPPEAAVGSGRTPAIEKPIVFYGSSITQGGCAGKAGSCYTTLLCRRLDAAQRNLGFSGSGLGEAVMAQYIAGLEMRAFVLDYDYNAPTAAHLQRTHEPFFQTIRQAQPELPILILSKPDFDLDPAENSRRRDVIYQTYQNAVAAGDRHVRFVDGASLYGEKDRDLCAVDGVHPNDLGFLRIADCLEPVLRELLAL